MENNYSSILSFIGLLYKGRGISFGDVLINEIKSRKVYLVIISNDSGTSVKKKIIDKCNFYGVEYIECFSKTELGNALGKNALSSIGIYSQKAVKKIKDILKREGISDEK